MDANQRAEKIVKCRGCGVGSYENTFVHGFHKECWSGSRSQMYQEGFNAAKEKAVGIADSYLQAHMSHVGSWDSGAAITSKAIADRIRQMESE